MEGMRVMALAYYENLSDEEKVSYQNDFAQAIAEERVSKYLYPFVEGELVDKCLKMYKGYTKGSFDFNDFIILRYILMNYTTVLVCQGCESLILGQAFFSCLDCFFSSPHSYDLCCSCYASKRFEDHTHSILYDSRTLLGISRATMLHLDQYNSLQKSEYIEAVMSDLALDFMELARSIKTEGWKDFRRRIPDNFDRRDVISRRFSKHIPSHLLPAKETLTEYAEKVYHALGSGVNVAGKDTKEAENSHKLRLPSQLPYQNRIDLVGEKPSTFNN